MSRPRPMTLRWFIRAINKRLSPRALILMYHSIAEVDSDPFALRVTPDCFAEHLEVLQKYCQPIPLSQLMRALRDGKIPNRAVVITFDDGYADNLRIAKPLLE